MSSSDDSESGTAYQVRPTPQALTDAEAAHDYIARDAPMAAERWFASLLKAMESLSRFPHRGAEAPEDRGLRIGLRQLIFGNYRILYTVDEVKKTVHVHRIRHGARLVAEPEEFDT